MTALGMVIGTASLILVVTIALTGKQFLLTQIQNVGANLIWAEYSSQTERGLQCGAPRLFDRGRHGRRAAPGSRHPGGVAGA